MVEEKSTQENTQTNITQRHIFENNFMDTYQSALNQQLIFKFFVS